MKWTVAIISILSGLTALAGTIIEAPEIISHRTSLMLEIKAVRWPTSLPFCGVVEARNQAARDTTLQVVLSGPRGSWRKEVAVPAGQTVRFPCYSPWFGQGPNSWEGYRISFIQPGDTGGPYYWASNAYFDSNDYNLSQLPLLQPRQPADLPQEPRLYWSFTTLSLTVEQWRDLASAKRDAILSWVALGGNLHLAGTETAALAEQLNLATAPSGQVTIGELPEHGALPGYFRNFARITIPTTVPLPVWLLVVLSIMAALALGPGTIWFCRRRRHPALALAIIPAISLALCLTILIFSLAHDGIRPKVRREVLTRLDQRTGLAVTNQQLAIEAPLGLFEPLVFPEEALVRLPDQGQPRCTVAGGQMFVRSAFLPRVPGTCAMLHREFRREQLDIRPGPSGQLLVVNGLGAEIRQLALCDLQGQFWHCPGPIPPGSEAELVPGPLPEPLLPNPSSPDFSNLIAGHYLARLEHQVFGAEIIRGGRPLGDPDLFLVTGSVAPLPPEGTSRP